MISLDPETGGHDPEVLRGVAQAHEANAGVYCAVLAEGMVAKGDHVEVIDS
jgi:MOSC domain-containing protein YiiM